MASEALARLQKMERPHRIRLAVAAAAVLACLAGILWYATRTDWRTLYAGMQPDDARETAAELTTAGIPYDVSPDGTVLRVPAEWLDKARLAATAKGGPKSGRMGFELFDKPNWVGSEFDEKVNYQRALEGELEHTIDTLGPVESSHVHLVMPHDSLFSEQQRDAKASVTLKLRDRTLSDEEADGIRHLVASAVDDLHPENVVLVDDAGRQLGRKSADAVAEAHEQALAERIVSTLEPVAGAGNVRASVNVDYDTSSADEVDETYDPNGTVSLSMQRSEQTSAPPQVSGIPGTASNAPNVQPPLYPSQSAQMQSIKQESATYGASKKVRHTVQNPGRVRRITAAILINYRQLGSSRQPQWEPRTQQEMQRLTDLAQAAVGYDASRGDQVSVEDIAFEENGAVQQANTGERLLRTLSSSQPLLKYATLLLGLLAVLFFAVRPAMHAIAEAGKIGAGELPVAALVSGDGAASEALEQPPIEQQKLRAQAVFDQVTEQMKGDPAQSARLLQSWIHTE
ncbi:flagellar basal-body MS-ring/collar protein FliF [Paracidobacterium acidisoli]|nr:flagellar basal-body MS-ring/collar protein FliF [Paracidobacterium acidisoli]MBT9330289.1 flagellar M-ring protein FliF [Paracidobacterium acidisoli]